MTSSIILRLACLVPAVLCLLLVCKQPAQAATEASIVDLQPVDAKRERTVPIRIYLPDQPESRPLILFSHGLGGSRENSVYLGKHWASAGYVCIFLQHHGSDKQIIQRKPLQSQMDSLRSTLNSKNVMDRIEDVSFILDQVETWNTEPSHPLFARVDLEHIGMSGHSFGAATTLAVAGRKFFRNRSFPEPRIDAFLAMSPQPVRGLSTEKTFGSLSKPLFCMTGTKDASSIQPQVTPAARQSVYAALPEGDKFQLVLEGAEHHAFSDEKRLRTKQRDPKHHGVIQELSTKFWQAYLEDDTAAKKWLQSNAPQTDEVLTKQDRWEWK
ncbi:Alpha/beta hydrolase family protein [Roseimaritima multifibrata]|uniref:Alpha/beta hydrolase family protein n=1 Tax=Roseimaritima multifibrata TaxID=1930274 RepID=A0A517MHK2_9BACT|nr:acetylhydrolase [Roseimaritima multifibrata]QDS94364.1 Alpha/beta hydrolase family protein [Roseimaritima multifibrata]